MNPAVRTATIESMTRRGWFIPAGLLALGFIPELAGAFRLAQLAGGAPVTADNARFFAQPAPVAVHIVGASVFCALGAFQFVPGLRRHRPGWHRAAGRVLVVAGIAAALSGLWMTLFYPLPDHDGVVLTVLRLIFGTGMVAFLVVGLLAALRRDFTRHRAWMMRGYAIGLGAGTQALTFASGFIVFGSPTLLGRALLMGAGWVINLAVAEAIIRRGRRRPRPAGTPALAGVGAR
jgi:uncharacterized membrane protein